MKALIFAGGSGKRFWPISREKMPKIFIPLLDHKSTFQLQIDRVKKIIGIENIFVSTNEKYVSIVKRQTPALPTSNIIAEPTKKDLLAALGYSLIKFRKMGITEPVITLASDHVIKNYSQFKNTILAGEEIVTEDKKKFVYFGEKPLFPTNNLGWIHIGKKLKRVNYTNVHEYKKWIYRPDIEKCKKMFATKEWVWNVNYEIFTVEAALTQYEKVFPKNYKKLLKIEKALDTKSENQIIRKIYPTLDEAHSDDLWSSATPSQAVVLNLNLGWSDPGTLYLLKKTLEKNHKENVTKGKVYNHESKDCLVYNYEETKLVTTFGLEGMIVVNTKDAILVIHKDQVRFLGDMLKEFKGTQLEKYL